MILIIGTGEQARVVIDNAEDQRKYKIFGLISNNKEEVGKKICGYTVVGEDYQVEEIIAQNPQIVGYFLGVGMFTGNMNLRQKLIEKYNKIIPAVNIIHPTAYISKYSVMGKGNLIEAFTRIANGVSLGDHCIINSFSAINHDQVVDDNVLIANNVSLAGKSIGSNSIIADGATVGFKRNVGRNCIIGEGSTVTKDIPDNSIALGSPAKVVRENN